MGGQLLGDLGHQRTAEVGDVLMHERAPGDDVIEIVSGRVKITASTGRRLNVVLGFRGPGELIGEIGMLVGQRSATVTAIEPLVYRSVSQLDFRRRLAADPDMAFELARRLAVRLIAAERRAALHLTSDATARIAARLVDLVGQYGADRPEIALPVSQEELAGLSGSSLESVARGLRTLREAGWIETGRRVVTVRDLAALEARSLA